jgi:hypothetical protein
VCTSFSADNDMRDMYRGRNEFKKGYQPRNNLANDENVNLLAYSNNISNRCQLLNVHVMFDRLEYIQLKL